MAYDKELDKLTYKHDWDLEAKADIATLLRRVEVDSERKGYLHGLNYSSGVAAEINNAVGIGVVIYQEYQRVKATPPQPNKKEDL